MKTLIGQSAVASLSPQDFKHPGQRVATFVFTDNLPNENGQGIEEEDFDQIIQSAIGSPMKMRFFGQAAGGHTGSIPIGYIRNMFKADAEDGSKQLIAEAILFADEYPDEVGYLESVLKDPEAEKPGVSWEMRYSESVIKDGIEWLKGLVTRAATFVSHPAYGARTAILALASSSEVTDEQFTDALTELLENTKNTTQGGNDRMDEETQKLQEKIAELEAQLAKKDELLTERESALAEKDSSITELTTERDELKTSVSEYEAKELVATRTSALVEAGVTIPTDPDKLATKQAHWASLSEEAFASYVEDLTEAIETAKKTEETKEGLASLRVRRTPTAPSLPRFSAAASSEEGDERPSAVGLKSKFKELSRTHASAESE